MKRKFMLSVLLVILALGTFSSKIKANLSVSGFIEVCQKAMENSDYNYLLENCYEDKGYINVLDVEFVFEEYEEMFSIMKKLDKNSLSLELAGYEYVTDNVVLARLENENTIARVYIVKNRDGWKIYASDYTFVNPIQEDLYQRGFCDLWTGRELGICDPDPVPWK